MTGPAHVLFAFARRRSHPGRDAGVQALERGNSMVLYGARMYMADGTPASCADAGADGLNAPLGILLR